MDRPRHSDEDEQERLLPGAGAEEYRDILHRFLMQRLRNSQDAYDLAQETYVRYYQISRSEAVRQPKSYLFRVAQNLIYEFRLRQSRERGVLTIDSALFEAEAHKAIDPANADPGEQLGDAQLLHRVLMQIPPGYRKVFIMNKRDGLSCGEISGELGLSRRSVEKYLARALAYAREALWK